MTDCLEVAGQAWILQRRTAGLRSGVTFPAELILRKGIIIRVWDNLHIQIMQDLIRLQTRQQADALAAKYLLNRDSIDVVN